MLVHARRGVVLACGGFPGNDELKRRVYGHVAAGKSHALAAAARQYRRRLAARPVGRRQLPRGGAPAGGLDAGLAGAAAGRLDHPVPAFLRPRQARLHQRRPARPPLRQRGEVLPRVRAGHDRGLPRRCRCGSLDRLRPSRPSGASASARWGRRRCASGRSCSSGYIKRSDSVRGLAQACGIDADGLERTRARVQRPGAARRGPRVRARLRRLPALQRRRPAMSPTPASRRSTTPPFYAVRVIPSELGTFAGIATNAHAQVVDRRRAGRSPASMRSATTPPA